MSQFNKQDESILREYFINNPGWHGLSKDELKETFSDYLINQTFAYRRTSTEYQNIINTADTQLRALPINVTGLSKAQISERATQRQYYLNERERAERGLERLNEEVKQFADNNVNWAAELKTVQSEINELAAPYGVNIDIAKNNAFRKARSVRRKGAILSAAERDIANTDYGSDPDVQNDVARLNAILGTGDIEDIYNNIARIKPIVDMLKTKRADYLKEAEKEVGTDFENYKTKLGEAENNYNSASQEIGAYAAPVTDVNGALQTVFATYGKELLSDNHSTFESEDAYQGLLRAYISSEFERMFHFDMGARIRSIDTLFSAAKRAGDTDSMKDLTDRMNSLKGRVNTAKRRAQSEMKKDLKEWYRYVAMNSELDPTSDTDEFYWHMFDSNGNVVDNHAVGTYAGGGVGFFRNLLDDAHFNYFTGGAYANIGELKKDVVKKHKKASQIGVDEVLLWGLYNAITESDRENIEDEIITRWNAVMWLDPTASLDDIKRTYRHAEELGREMTLDAKSWTTRENDGYVKLDDEVNKASGILYASVDAAEDRIKWFFKQLKAKPKQGQVEEPVKPYDVDITAIKPKSHVVLKSIFGALVLPYVIYKIGTSAWDVLTKEETRESHMTELVENVGIAVGSSAITKWLSTA